MRRRSISIDIKAPCDVVFDLIHDYRRRLEWDPMLSRAELLEGRKEADVGARSLCVGRWRTGFIPMETEYVRFERGEVAAVKLTNRPPFFSRFAATIRHRAVGPGTSRATYIYAFDARPSVLAPFLNPILDLFLAREVGSRLSALRDFLELRGGDHPTARPDQPVQPTSLNYS